jgi:hypothetical protein
LALFKNKVDFDFPKKKKQSPPFYKNIILHPTKPWYCPYPHHGWQALAIPALRLRRQYYCQAHLKQWLTFS